MGRHDALFRQAARRRRLVVVRRVVVGPVVVRVIASRNKVQRVGYDVDVLRPVVGREVGLLVVVRARKKRLYVAPHRGEVGSLVARLRRYVGRIERLYVDRSVLAAALARHAEVAFRPIAFLAHRFEQRSAPELEAFVAASAFIGALVYLRLPLFVQRRVGRPRIGVGASSAALTVDRMQRIGHPHGVVAPRVVAIGVVAHALLRFHALRPVREESIVALDGCLAARRFRPVGRELRKTVATDRIGFRPGCWAGVGCIGFFWGTRHHDRFAPGRIRQRLHVDPDRLALRHVGNAERTVARTRRRLEHHRRIGRRGGHPPLRVGNHLHAVGLRIVFVEHEPFADDPHIGRLLLFSVTAARRRAQNQQSCQQTSQTEGQDTDASTPSFHKSFG